MIGRLSWVAALGLGVVLELERTAGDLDGLDEPDQQLDSRIDFVFARSREECELVVDPPDDADGDGTGTGLFAVGPLDPPVNGLVWFSDHHGVMADVALACS